MSYMGEGFFIAFVVFFLLGAFKYVPRIIEVLERIADALEKEDEPTEDKEIS